MAADTEIKVACPRCQSHVSYVPTGLRVTRLLTPATVTYYEFFCRLCFRLNIVPCHVSVASTLEEAGVATRTLVVPAEVYERHEEGVLSEGDLAKIMLDLETLELDGSA